MERNHVIQMEMENGTVDLTLSFYRLHQLKTKHPEEYQLYFSLQKDGIQTDLDAVVMLYIAYLCANLEKMPDVMSYEEFLMNLRNGRQRIWETYNELFADAKN